MTRAEEKAIDAWAVYEYREHPKGLYHTCFVDGYKEGYEQAEKDIKEVIVKHFKYKQDHSPEHTLHWWVYKNVIDKVNEL